MEYCSQHIVVLYYMINTEIINTEIIWLGNSLFFNWMTINSICIQLGAADEVKLKLLNAKPSLTEHCLVSSERAARREEFFSPFI